jgi:hypothetical protein
MKSRLKKTNPLGRGRQSDHSNQSNAFWYNTIRAVCTCGGRRRYSSAIRYPKETNEGPFWYLCLSLTVYETPKEKTFCRKRNVAE